MDIRDADLFLEKHFNSVSRIILDRQDPVTGLLPASTAVNAHGDYTDAWVRDNVYSILCVWGLALSYKKHRPDHHRTHLLTQSTVKLMRGLLGAMMRQSGKVEAFKYSLNPSDALHAKYGTNSALPVVGDNEWGHLQLDATSLFLLKLAQMTASGLVIIYTLDEVDFIQNLVHYISRTYCCSDYGIWERGNKINMGTPEINGSSVGMAKAALEALDGFNLFGNVSCNEAVIHVISNDIARSRFTLQGLLPRESNSKETDAALLSIIGYPAYAVEDEELVNLTRNRILEKLCGNYGCKRFLRDGHQSCLEDENRLYYEPYELKMFENIESQWPLFFTYLLLDSLLRGDKVEAEKWNEKLKPLFIDQDKELLLPELYIVPESSIEAEKKEPGSQERLPNENIPLVWAQSLYMLSEMILDGILEASLIDPLKRRERIGHKRVSTPLVAILAQNEEIKRQLSNHGIKSETLQDAAPLKIMYSDELSKIHTKLGENRKLGLSGRPFLESRTITSSYLYGLGEDEIIFLPYYFNPKGFYFSYDNQLLAEHFISSLKFLARNWEHEGQPIIAFFVRPDMLLDKDRELILKLLNSLQNGCCKDIVVKQGFLGQLKNTASVQKISYLGKMKLQDISIEHKESQYFDSIKEMGYSLDALKLQKLYSASTGELVDIVADNTNRLKTAIVLKILLDRNGEDFKINIGSLSLSLGQIAQIHYKYATLYHDWAAVRRLSHITKKYDDNLEDSLLDIVIRQKQLAVGRAYNEKATFSQPLDSLSIIKRIEEFCGTNTAEDVITQEIILHLGHLIRTEPDLFKNILTIRTWYFVQLLVGQISYERSLSIGEAYEYLISLAPHEIYKGLRGILESFTQKVQQLGSQETINISGVSSIEKIRHDMIADEPDEDIDWLKHRKETGMIGHLSEKLHNEVWYILQQCSGVIIGDKYDINSKIASETTFESTPDERSFELLIDNQLQRINAPEYRQLNIELIESLSRLFRENPHIKVKGELVFDVLIGHGVRIAWCKRFGGENYNEKRAKAWELIYRLSPKEVDEVFVEAFMYLLNLEEKTGDEK